MTTTLHASGWQIGATIATACAAGIALVAVIVNMCQRRVDNQRLEADKAAQALAQARLIIVGGNPGSDEVTVDAEAYGVEGDSLFGEGVMWESKFRFENHSDRPVLDVYAEIWLGGYQLSDRPLAVHERVALTNTTAWLRLRMHEKMETLTAWRVRWTDADGRQWFVDQYPYEKPERFEGKEPRRHGAPIRAS